MEPEPGRGGLQEETGSDLPVSLQSVLQCQSQVLVQDDSENQSSHFYGAQRSGTTLNTWHILTCIIFETVLSDSYHYYPHFIDDKTEAQESQIPTQDNS